MRKLKKALVVCSLALTLVMSTDSIVHAQGMRTIACSDEIAPRWSYIESIGIGLGFNDLGKATCYTVLTAQRGDYQCKVESTLYQLDGGTWKALKSWSDTGAGSIGVIESYYVKSGYMYRLRSKCSVYNPSGTTLLETHTEYYEKGN